MRRRLGLVVLSMAGLSMAGLSTGGAHADESPERRVASARDGIASVLSALAAYATSEPEDSETRPWIQDFLTSLGDAPPEPVPGVPADALEQDRLAAFDERVSELSARLRERREELLHGSAADAPPPAETESAFLDVQAILSPPADSPGPLLGLRSPESADALAAVKGRTRVMELEGFEWALQEIFEDANAHWTVTNGLLHVRGTSAEIARARALVTALREAAGARVALDVRAYRMTHGLWRELAKGGVALSADDEAKLAQAVGAGEASLVVRQTVIARDGQVVHAWRGSSKSYLSGLEVNQTGVVPVLQPTTDRLDTGLCAELRAAVDAPRSSVLLDLSFSLCEPRAGTKEKVQGFELELPEVAAARAVTTVSIPLGRSALVAGTFAASDSGLEAPLAYVVFVRATLVPPSPEGRRTVLPAPRAPEKPAPRALRADVTVEQKAEAERLAALLGALATRMAPVREARRYRWSIHDVRELLEGRREHAAPPLGLPPLPRPVAPPNPNGGAQGGGVLTFGDEDEPPKREKALEPAVIESQALAASGGTHAWSGRGRSQVSGGNLLVFQTPGTIAAVHSALAGLELSRARTVRLEAGLYELSPELLAALDAGTGNGCLDRAQLAKIDASAKLLASGFIAARPGDRVHIQQGTDRSYLRTFEAFSGGTTDKIEKGSLPVIATLRAGLSIDARIREEGASLAVEAKVSLVRVKELARAQTPDGAIAAPVLDVDELSATAPIGTEGGGALVTVTKDGKTVALVVRASTP